MARKLSTILLGAALTLRLVLPAIAQSAAQPSVAELKQRFEQGRLLYSSGQYAQALTLFARNLAIDPNSKGSLLFSALACIQLGEFSKANADLDRFLQLEPHNAEGLIAAIKTKQALRRDHEVETLRRRLKEDRAAGLEPRLKVMLSYEREVIYQSDGSRISILENFSADGNYLWLYLLLDKDKKTIKRRLELAAVPTVDQTYVLGETRVSETGVSGYKIYQRYSALPSYDTAKTDALVVLLER
ncbi:MAG: tetratricopeptide repeat protein [Verrucomicrobiales bacterium]|jgi:tetratricopeptide (TPR) repeat protein|nr:tetratricopeptide repeat protein [Verrucomicrobiales bacterium]